MGRAFVRRYRRDANLRVDDSGCVTTRMAHVAALRKITATLFGDAVTIAATDCRIVGDSTVWTGLPCGSLVTLDYEHGLDGDVPRGVIGAVKQGWCALRGVATFARIYLIPVKHHALPDQVRLAPAW